MANHNKRKQTTKRTIENSKQIQRRQGRENACDQVAIGLGFASDWLSSWREFFKLNESRSVVKQTKAIPGMKFRHLI